MRTENRAVYSMHPGGTVKEQVTWFRLGTRAHNSIISNKFHCLNRLDGVEERSLYFEKAMLRFRQARFLLMAAGSLVLAATPAPAQSVERQVVVTAVDRDRAPVANLRAEDFVVREDGTMREVVRAHQDTEPRQIALLIDTSQAAEQAIADFRAAVSTFIDDMADPHDISLISFGGPPRILVPSTSNKALLRDGVGRVFAQSSSAAYLLDAIRETTLGFVKREAVRPVIIVLGVEGLDHSHTDASTILKGLDETSIAVHAVMVKTRTAAGFGASRLENPVGGLSGGFSGDLDEGLLPRWRLERDRGLNRAPRLSGGSQRDLLTSMGATAALRELAAELRSQYLVAYASPDTIVPPQHIEVASSRADLTVRRTPVRASQ